MPVLRSRQTGDMYVQVVVETPQNLTKKQQELLAEFEKLSSGATRAIATARSASFATLSPPISLVETTACRLPTSTRSPTSSPSERSDSST